MFYTVNIYRYKAIGANATSSVILYTGKCISPHCNPLQGQYRARTGISLCTFPSRENPVFITGMGLQCLSVNPVAPIGNPLAPIGLPIGAKGFPDKG